jgi:hypothetical protein
VEPVDEADALAFLIPSREIEVQLPSTVVVSSTCRERLGFATEPGNFVLRICPLPYVPVKTDDDGISELDPAGTVKETEVPPHGYELIAMGEPA